MHSYSNFKPSLFWKGSFPKWNYIIIIILCVHITLESEKLDFLCRSIKCKICIHWSFHRKKMSLTTTHHVSPRGLIKFWQPIALHDVHFLVVLLKSTSHDFPWHTDWSDRLIPRVTSSVYSCNFLLVTPTPTSVNDIEALQPVIYMYVCMYVEPLYLFFRFIFLKVKWQN